jgi:ABC-type bacteriocin/lantibiotic exporter with double-glycine peptidase domain
MSGGVKFAIVVLVFSLVIGTSCLVYHVHKRKKLQRELREYSEKNGGSSEKLNTRDDHNALNIDRDDDE